MKLYQNGDRCPCCGTILEGKTRKWLAEFSQLVEDLHLPPWPGLAESWDADAMNEQAPKGGNLPPVPDHGDLIDRNALLKEIGLGDLPILLNHIIREAPTIIPAEE